MFISKSKKSPFYQVTFKVNGKRTAISTKTANKREANNFLFNLEKEESIGTSTGIISPKNFITIDSFKTEYPQYFKPIKSQNTIQPSQVLLIY